MRSSCIACLLTADKRPPATCSTDRARGSGSRPRIGCTRPGPCCASSPSRDVMNRSTARAAAASSSVAATPIEAANDHGRITKAQRQHRIAQLLAKHQVTSQPQLVELLAAEGVTATQTTVSRDLEDLGAVKVRVPGGDTVYAIPEYEPDR